MKTINVRFENDSSLDNIDIVIRADKQDEQIDSLIEIIKNNSIKKLTVLDRNNCPCVISEDEIVFVSADGKNVRITANSDIYHTKQSLQNIEEILKNKFLRVSRFELINLSMVRRYDFTIGGTLRIEFVNGMETWASRRYIPLIRSRLSGEEGYLC